MRARQLRDLTDVELQRRLEETRQELFNLRFQSATARARKLRAPPAGEARDRAHLDHPLRARGRDEWLTRKTSD
jgi:hypothetical protein